MTASDLLSPTFGMGDPAYIASQADHHPSMACAPAVCLAVWFREQDHYLMAARVSPDGTPLDPGARLLTRASSANPAVVSVAFDGANFLVVWSAWQDGLDRVVAMRVSPSGAVLDPAPVLVSAGTGSQDSPSVASNGSVSLAVWTESTGGASLVRGARLSAGGAVLDPSGIDIGPAAYSWAHVAAGGSTFLVVWDDLDAHAARVGEDGAVLDSPALALSSDGGAWIDPAVAFDGTNFLAAWPGAHASTVFGARVTPQGVDLDPGGITLATAQQASTVSWNSRALAFNGSSYLLACGMESEFQWRLVGTRISTDGTVLASNIVIGGPVEGATVTAGTGGHLVAWSGEGTATSVRLARVSESGAVSPLNGALLSTTASSQLEPVAAFDGTNLLAVWTDDRLDSKDDLFAARLTTGGASLDPAGIAVTAAPFEQHNAAVAYDGNAYLAVWRDESFQEQKILGARVDRSGHVLNPNGILIGANTPASGRSAPSVAFDGTNHLVVWAETRSATLDDVRGARVTPSGAVLDPSGFAISAGAGNQRSPHVASGGAGSLVAWLDDRNGGTDIYAARVSTSGFVADPSGIPVAVSPVSRTSPRAAAGTGGFLLTWRSNADILAARVSNNGELLDPAGLAVATGTAAFGLDPAVGFDGRVYLVVWSEWPSGAPAPSLRGRRFTPGGVALDPAPFTIGSDLAWQSPRPSVTSAGPGQVAVLYSSIGLPGLRPAPRAAWNLVRSASPVALPATVITPEDTQAFITLQGTSAGGPLTFAVRSPPSHGSLSGSPPHLLYAPSLNFSGADQFTFTVSDGVETSPEATVGITVTPVNDPPVTAIIDAFVNQGQTLPLHLAALDPDGDPLTFAVDTSRTSGSVSGTPPDVVYTPPLAFRGLDGFTFTASDGAATSAPGQVAIVVNNVGPTAAPAASPASARIGQPVQFTAGASDPGGDPLTYAWSFGDGSTSTQPAPVHAFSMVGSYTVTVTVSDGLASTTAPLVVRVLRLAPPDPSSAAPVR